MHSLVVTMALGEKQSKESRLNKLHAFYAFYRQLLKTAGQSLLSFFQEVERCMQDFI